MDHQLKADSPRPIKFKVDKVDRMAPPAAASASAASSSFMKSSSSPPVDRRIPLEGIELLLNRNKLPSQFGQKLDKNMEKNENIENIKYIIVDE